MKHDSLNNFTLWLEQVGPEKFQVIKRLLQQIAEDITKYDNVAENVINVNHLDGKIALTTARGSRLYIFVNSLDKLVLTTDATREYLFEYEIPSKINVENLSWHFVTQVVPYICTNFLMAEINPPLVDLSVQFPLDEKDLKRASKLFNVLSPSDLQVRGSVNIAKLDLSHDYVVKKSSKTSIAKSIEYSKKQLWDLPKLHEPKIVLVKNTNDNFLTYNMRELRRALLDVKFNGRMAREIDNYQVIWGSGKDEGDLVYTQTNNICDFITYMVKSPNGNVYPVTVHTIPNFPMGYETMFEHELKHFVSEFKPFDLDFKAKFNMLEFMRLFWDSNVDEQFFIGGFVFHRDGYWGVYYDVVGLGQGNLLQRGAKRELYFGYTFVPPEIDNTKSGFLRVFVDSNNATNQGATWTPGWTDIQWYFHSKQDTQKVMQCLRDYTHSY